MAFFVPITSFEGQAIDDATKPNSIGYNAAGDLIVRDADGTGLRILCEEVPYRRIVEETKIVSLLINRLRITVQTDAQIDSSLVMFTRVANGRRYESVINARAYLSPNQFQGKIIDINEQFRFNAYSGLYMIVKAGETVAISCFGEDEKPFNLKIISNAARDLVAEIFAPLDSAANRTKTEYAGILTGVNYITLDFKKDGLPFTGDRMLSVQDGYENGTLSITPSRMVLNAGFTGQLLRFMLPQRGIGAFNVEYAVTTSYLGGFTTFNTLAIGTVFTNGLWRVDIFAEGGNQTIDVVTL